METCMTKKSSNSRRRSINCAECGETVHDAAPRRKYCESCSTEVIKRRSNKGGHKQRSCIECGDVFEPRSGAQKFCSLDCRQSEENRRRRLKTVEAGGGSLGSIFKCEDCGVELVRKSGAAKRCSECRDAYKKIAFREWADENRDSINARKARYRLDPKYRLDSRMGCAIWQCLRDNKRGWRWETLVGYSLEDLIKHIEGQFLKGMSWDNMSDWHIDHRVPKSSFQYETPECQGFKDAWALTNLQPLWKTDNLKKGASRVYLI